MKITPYTLFFAILLLVTSSAHAQVFKCKGTDGRVSYSDAPCASIQQGEQVKLTSNVLETRERREREAMVRELQEQQQSEQQWLQQQRTITQSTPQIGARFPISSDCKRAMRNAEVRSVLKPPTQAEIELAHKATAKICGFDPWPGRTLEKQERREARKRENEDIQQNPTVIGNDGVVYNRVPGGAVRTTDGKFCPKSGEQLYVCN